MNALMTQTGADVALLQEAGGPPNTARHLRDVPQDVFYLGDGSLPPVREYEYGGTRGRPRYLYWLRTDDAWNSATGRVNLAIATRTQVQPQNIYVVQAGLDDGWVGRPALGVNIGGVVYFTIHGLSGNGAGNDDPGLLRNIRARMATAGPGGTPLPWIALGDYNRAPRPPTDGTPDRSLSTVLAGEFRVFAPHTPSPPTEIRSRRGSSTTRSSPSAPGSPTSCQSACPAG
ncbi:endonuclease/exonuclease/phosphatase family protein [Nonomuraea sp. NPDC003804]|uniref:endonuclease/exonuclease/phosphatase family protein n=1 Tax=Nonomuraea sp. NPDC003804 TaxID=3154547 RepID=UPI0033AE3E5F